MYERNRAVSADDAVEDGHLAHNPARSKRMRLSVPTPRRTFLEMDELAALLDAAAAQDATYPPRRLPTSGRPRASSPTCTPKALRRR